MPENNARKWDLCCGCCFHNKKDYPAEAVNKVTSTSSADLPYCQDLKEQLRPGSCIIIRGSIKPHCKRFAVNLLYNHGSKSDIVFHFNPRLALRYIVRNSRINNSWGEEETTSIEKFHLDRNKTFELQIIATENEFLVALDGRHICAYVYRIPLEKINNIQVEGTEVEGIEFFQQIKVYPSVEGALNMETVQHKETQVYPCIAEDVVPVTVPMAGTSNHEIPEKLIVPITAHLPNGFQTGWQLEIAGRVKILPSSFYINLQQGDRLWPHPVIPLHLNPRFYTSYGNHLFVRNSWIDGRWGSEERTSGFQFTPGKTFHLAIRKNADNFSVWIDGTLSGEFRFRTPVDKIDTVYIHGDLKVQSILMKDFFDDNVLSRSRESVNRV